MSYIIIFTTTPDKESAQKIADKLLEKNLAACIGFASVFSNYKWHGRICKEEEIELHIKTKAKNYKKVEKLVKSLHSYETPQIIAVKIARGFDGYLKWIDKTLKAD
ncbi:MAG: divalent-cation tolerance protein CutA [Campylobacteraceae bacterium]|jgi:periplasmic divalent cation tolerance protein|nr:divalent-cation tolerance protein CutA [Campylobacteraceae bacterium]